MALLEREQRQRERVAVADERARIARELHDVVAHSVGVMVVHAQGARRVLDRDPARAREALETIERTGQTALDEMRRALGVLRRPDAGAPLAPQPGMDDLGALVEQARESGLTVELVTEGDPTPLPAGVDLSAYRIVQEALTNTLKHAGPVRARVAVRYARRRARAGDLRRRRTRPRAERSAGRRRRARPRGDARARRALRRRPARRTTVRRAASSSARRSRSRREHRGPDRRRPGADARRLPDGARVRGRHRGGGRGGQRRAGRPQRAAACSPTSC